MDKFGRKAAIRNEVSKQLNETIHLGAPGDCAAEPLIHTSTLLLLLLLGSPSGPIYGYSLLGAWPDLIKCPILLHKIETLGTFLVS